MEKSGDIRRHWLTGHFNGPLEADVSAAVVEAAGEGFLFDEPIIQRLKGLGDVETYRLLGEKNVTRMHA